MNFHKPNRILTRAARPAALIEANLRDLLRQLGEAVAGRAGVPVTVVRNKIDLLDEPPGIAEADGRTVVSLSALTGAGIDALRTHLKDCAGFLPDRPGALSARRRHLDALARETTSADELVALCMRCGEVNLTVMGMLDEAHTTRYGHPEPTPVRIHPKKGKAILVSGHDLKDLEEILKQSQGKGINVYTHGEMLPTHAYPKLKAFEHLAGNYGGAWQDQSKRQAD